MTEDHGQDDNQSDGQDVVQAVALGPKAVMEAQQRGQAAALAGEPVTACPWAQATTPADQAAREEWVRGYAAGRTRLRGT